jgi:hypothetical protein
MDSDDTFVVPFWQWLQPALALGRGFTLNDNAYEQSGY